MPIITTSPTRTERIEGAEHGATVSLILDRNAEAYGISTSLTHVTVVRSAT